MNIKEIDKNNESILEKLKFINSLGTQLFIGENSEFEIKILSKEELINCYPDSSEKVKSLIKAEKTKYFISCINYRGTADCVNIPYGIDVLAPRSFKEKQFTNINIPDSVKFILSYCFFGCNKIKEINVPDSVIAIEKQSLGMCFSIEKIKLGKSIKYIGTNFAVCTKIKKLKIPNGVEYLSIQTLRGLLNLEEIDLPNSLTDVEGVIFDCNNSISMLRNIIVHSERIYNLFKDKLIYGIEVKLQEEQEEFE